MSCARSLVVIVAAACGLAAAWIAVIHRPSAASSHEKTGEGDAVSVAHGVVYRYFAEGSSLVSPGSSDALVLDVDLNAPGVSVVIAADSPVRKAGKVFGVAHTVKDWCAQQAAVGGVNGGFYGDTEGGQKQAEGMLIIDGTLYNAGRWVRSGRKPNQKYLRCAFGIDDSGVPAIGWATAHSGSEVMLYDHPVTPASGHSVPIASAVACGPRLIAGGREQITDAEERLVSSPALPRTFIAYDDDGGTGAKRPRHLVMGIAMQMTYRDVAAFLTKYYQSTHHCACAEAMCLDGGSSSQLAYRAPPGSIDANADRAGWVDTRPFHITVPTALLVKASR